MPPELLPPTLADPTGRAAPRLRPAPLTPGPFTATERRSVLTAAAALGIAAHALWSNLAAAARMSPFDDATPVWAGIAVLAAPLVAFALGPPLEKLAARFGFRSVAAIALALAAAGAAGTALARSPELLCVARLFVGLAALELAAASWLPAWVDEARFARGATALAMAGAVGAVTGLSTGMLVAPHPAMWISAGALIAAAALAALGPRPAQHCKEEFHPPVLEHDALAREPALGRLLQGEQIRGAALGASIAALPWILHGGSEWPPFISALALVWLASRARTLAAATVARRLAQVAACAGAVALGMHALWPPLSMLGVAAMATGLWVGEAAGAAEVTHRAAEMRLAAGLALRARAVWQGLLFGALGWSGLSLLLTSPEDPTPAAFPLLIVALGALGATFVSTLRKKSAPPSP